MKPPFAYFGGKSGMAGRISSLLPPHQIYLEPFAGSLAVFFAKAPATHEIINDVDHAIVTFFRVLRERPDELEQVCRLTPYARDEFDAATLAEDLDELELARQFWVRVNQSFAKTAGRQTGFSMTIGQNQASSVGVQSRIGRFAACAERLSRAAIENGPAVEVIRRLGDRPGTVIYADPPYLGTSRSHGSSTSVEYRFDMAGDEAHAELAEALHESPATVVLSCYPSELYDKLYSDWWFADFSVTAHSSNARSSGRTGRTERIYSNRDLVDGRFDVEVMG